MNNYKQSKTGYNQMPGYNEVMPPLPTGNPTGPQYSPYPVSPEILSQIGMQPGMPLAPLPGIQPQPIPFPEVPPGGCECPTPIDMQSGMRTRPRFPSGAIMPLPGTEFTGGEQPPLTTLSPMYTPGFLRTQIGRTVRVEFLIGTSGLTDRFGTLVGVGTSYILIQEAQSDDILLCDIYSIKFVRFYH